MIKSVYIHIPFCKNICSYCDFPKVYYNESLVSKYLDFLELEIKEKYQNEKIETIYIGGGTPSALSLKELNKLFRIISLFKTSKNLEYTIECNFDSTTEDKLNLFKKYGINRISFGLETTHKKYSQYLNRNISKDEVINIVKLCKDRGFNNINVDLMYALKNETLKDLEKDLDFVLSLNIEHISTYSLIIEHHTKLFVQKEKNISEDLDYNMYSYILERLNSNGFKHYEISNFSKAKKESIHNLCYWNNLEYYGFGIGASSYVGNVRYTNTRSFKEYFLNNYVSYKEELSESDKQIYEMILGLRKIEGVDKNKFFKKYNCKVEDKFDIIDLVNKGLIINNEKFIFIPANKLYIQNSILLEMMKGSSGNE